MQNAATSLRRYKPELTVAITSRRPAELADWAAPHGEKDRGAHPVGAVLATQLVAFADDLTTAQIDDRGHLIPLDAPDRLLAELVPWLDAD